MARNSISISRRIGGYLVNFCAPLPDEYLCSICFLAFKDPVQAPCGHLFCKSCWDFGNRGKWTAQCPLDYETIFLDQVYPDKAVEKKILSLEVKCKYFCEWTGELQALEDHMKNCPLDFIPCPHPECRTPVRRNRIHIHTQHECQFRRIACIYCSDVYVVRDAQEHLEICRSYPIECLNGCPSKEIKRENMEEHLQSCPLTSLPCRYEEIGCNFVGTKALREMHEVTAVQDHLSMAMQQIKIQSQRAEKAIEKKSAVLKLNKDVEFQYGQKRITIKSWRMQEKMIW